jgi:hypothetical protein
MDPLLTEEEKAREKSLPPGVPPNAPTLSVAIVTYNNRSIIEACLRATQKACEGLKAEIIVVDNASADGTAEVVRRHAPPVQLIAEPRNHGFSAGCNIAVRQAKGVCVFFLNPDAFPEPSGISAMLRYLLEHRDVGVLGCRLIGEDGKVSPSMRGFPTFASELYLNTALRRLGTFRKDYERYRMEDFDCSRTSCVDWVAGAAMLVRRDVFMRIGGFDERFFMYFEDADLCRSIRDAGLKVVYFSGAAVRHIGGHSSRQNFARKRSEALCSMMKFFRKHHGRTRTWAFKCVFLPLAVLHYALSSARDILRAILGRREKSAHRFQRARAQLSFVLWRWVLVALA